MNVRAKLARAKAALRLPHSVSDPFRTFAAKQDLARPSRYYGDGGTIHQTRSLDVEVDSCGHVVAVWFRCQMLPFEERRVSDARAEEMDRAYARDGIPVLTGVEVLDAEGK